KFRPYKIHLHEGLDQGDYDRRLAFIAWLVTAREDRITNKILWTDESRFHNNGIANRHNCHYWSADNLHWLGETHFQRIWGINVWCGIIDGYIIGPKFFNGTLASKLYLQNLENELHDYLENVPLNLRENMILQQDGAPPHNFQAVSAYLDLNYPGRW